MSLIQEFLKSFRQDDSLEPGLFQKDDGTVWLRNPDSSETQLPGTGNTFDGGTIHHTLTIDPTGSDEPSVKIGETTEPPNDGAHSQLFTDSGLLKAKLPDNSVVILGGGGLGVWKTYLGDSSSGLGPIVGFTPGNGILNASWWTPAPVLADPATDPFLCVLQIYFTLGSTSSVDGDILVGLPNGVDGSGNDLRPASPGPFFILSGAVVAEQSGSFFPGCYIGDTALISPDGTHWDATHPFAWAEGDSFAFTSTFQAKFIAD